MSDYELIVVGGGPAGITLAKMLGKKMKMAVIRPEDYSMIYCAMPYVIEGLIDTEKTLKKDALVTDGGADLIRDEVSEILFDKKIVKTKSGEAYGYSKIVIATGATPFIPPIEGASLNGVRGFKTESDLKSIKNRINEGLKKAVVVGAGAIGIELAQALKDTGLEVDLVDMGSSVLPNLVDKDMTEELEAEIIKKGIRLHLNAKVTSLGGKEWVEHVNLDNGKTIHFDARDECSIAEDFTHDGIVIFAAGMKPEIELVKNSGIELGRDGIIVNNRMETSIRDVYAVGDCAQFTSGITCASHPGKLATNAVPMAKVLGFNLLGQNRSYPGFFNGAATRVGRWYVGGTGLSETAAAAAGYDVVTGYSELTTQFPIMPDARKISFKLIVDKRTDKILGGQVVSGEPVTSVIDLITFAIQKESKVEDFSSLSYSSQPYQSFFPAANGIVLASEQIIKKTCLD